MANPQRLNPPFEAAFEGVIFDLNTYRPVVAGV
jgi:hypothetical protein